MSRLLRSLEENDQAVARRREWIELDRESLWHPFTQSDEWFAYDPLVIERAEGFSLIDVDGRRYLDGVSSLWCNVHGHGRSEINDAVHAQLDRMAHSTMLGLTHTPGIELADRLLRIAPAGLTRVFYSDSGSTAVEVALRMAFQYQRQIGQSQRTRFVSLEGGYHGDTLGSVSLGYSEPFHTGYEPITFRSLKFNPPFLHPPIDGVGDCTPDNLAIATRASLAQLEALLAEEGSHVAALFLEPLMQGAAGMWPQPVSFLRGVRELCDRYEILMVCDEVATGFARTGTMFAVEQAEVEPDILCLAKGLTGGYLPLAATLSSEEIFAAFSAPYTEYKTLFHGHTYGGNPLGCAAALANLDLFAREDTVATAAAHGKYIGDLLEREIEPLAHVGPIRRCGLMIGFDILADPASGRSYPTAERRAHHAVMAAREAGVIIRPLGDTMVLMPAPAMPEHLLAELVSVTAQAIRRATED